MVVSLKIDQLDKRKGSQRSRNDGQWAGHMNVTMVTMISIETGSGFITKYSGCRLSFQMVIYVHYASV